MARSNKTGKQAEQIQWGLVFERVSLNYGGKKPIFQNFNFSLFNRNGSPQRYALIGESGSGKTTLIQLIFGYLVPQEGRILFNGKEIRYDEKFLRKHRASIGFVSQNLNGMISYLNVLENVQRPALLEGLSSNEATERAHVALEKVGLNEGLWNKGVTQLSGGELQRALIAKTIVKRPSFLICDEPTSALDHPNSKRVVEAIIEVNIPTLIVTHDPALFAPYMDGLSLLANGLVLDITCLKNNPVLGTFTSSRDLAEERCRIVHPERYKN